MEMTLPQRCSRLAGIKAKDANDLTAEDVVFILEHGPRLEAFPIISTNPFRQAFYIHCRMNRQSHTIAEMCALQVSPGIMGTDSNFMEGHCNGNQFEKQPKIGDYYRRQATKAGVNTTGKVYLSGLAAFPGDPQAWVSGRSDVTRVVNERNWGCQGAVNRTAVRGIEGKPDVGVADGIINDRVGHLVAKGEVQPKDVPEFKEKLKKELAPVHA
jgi:hypothetical protein